MEGHMQHRVRVVACGRSIEVDRGWKGEAATVTSAWPEIFQDRITVSGHSARLGTTITPAMW